MDNPDDEDSPDSPESHRRPGEEEEAIRDRRVAGISAQRDTLAGSERTVVERIVHDRERDKAS